MKRFLLFFAVLIIISAVNAQKGGGFSRGNSVEMRSKMKQRIKDELQLTDVQADSVMSINQRYQAQIRAAKEDENISSKEMEAQVMGLQVDRKKELKIILTDEQIEKLQTLEQSARKMREQRKNDEERKD